MRPLSSPVDWCEENYEVTPYVAEFWNSVSSFSMVVLSMVGPRFIDKRVDQFELQSFNKVLIIRVRTEILERHDTD